MIWGEIKEMEITATLAGRDTSTKTTEGKGSWKHLTLQTETLSSQNDAAEGKHRHI